VATRSTCEGIQTEYIYNSRYVSTVCSLTIKPLTQLSIWKVSCGIWRTVFERE
jgi:hypothetical protein